MRKERESWLRRRTVPPGEGAAGERGRGGRSARLAGLRRGGLLRRDYIIPGVEADDPDPYKWHTARSVTTWEDAIEIIDLVKQFGRTRILNGCNLGLPDNMISMVLGPSGRQVVLIKHIVGLSIRIRATCSSTASRSRT
jgi:hypothetical protein